MSRAGSGLGELAGFGECVNEQLVSIKCGNSLTNV